MKAEQLSGAARDERDDAFMSELRALPKFMGGFSSEALAHQVEVGRRMRETWVKFFPHLRASFDGLPELEKV